MRLNTNRLLTPIKNVILVGASVPGPGWSGLRSEWKAGHGEPVESRPQPASTISKASADLELLVAFPIGPQCIHQRGEDGRSPRLVPSQQSLSPSPSHGGEAGPHGNDWTESRSSGSAPSSSTPSHAATCVTLPSVTCTGLSRGGQLLPQKARP